MYGEWSLGFAKVKARIWNVESLENAMEVTHLADAGVSYTVLPETPLKTLVVKSIGRRGFRPTNNQVLEKEIGMEVNGMMTHTIAVFSDENMYLLEVLTLEGLGLEVGSIKRLTETT